MPTNCVVNGCLNRANQEKRFRFFRIPGARDTRGRPCSLKTRRRNLWVLALRLENLSEEKIKNAFICSDHFIAGKPADVEDEHNPDYVPSLNLGYKRHDKNCSEAKMTRHNRFLNRKKRSEIVSLAKEKFVTEPTQTSIGSTTVVPEIETPKDVMESPIKEEVCIKIEDDTDPLGGIFIPEVVMDGTNYELNIIDQKSTILPDSNTTEQTINDTSPIQPNTVIILNPQANLFSNVSAPSEAVPQAVPTPFTEAWSQINCPREFSLAICRVCMLSGVGKMMFPVDYSIVLDGINIYIQNMIFIISDVKVDADDGLPPEVCVECLQLIVNAFLLKKQCNFSNATLRNLAVQKFEHEKKHEITKLTEQGDQQIKNSICETRLEIAKITIEKEEQSAKIKNDTSIKCDITKREQENALMIKHEVKIANIKNKMGWVTTEILNERRKQVAKLIFENEKKVAKITGKMYQKSETINEKEQDVIEITNDNKSIDAMAIDIDLQIPIISKKNTTALSDDLQKKQNVYCQECCVTFPKTEVQAHMSKCKMKLRAINVTPKVKKLLVCRFCNYLVYTFEMDAHKIFCHNSRPDESCDLFEFESDHDIINEVIPNIQQEPATLELIKNAALSTIKEKINEDFKQKKTSKRIVECAFCKKLVFAYEMARHKTWCNNKVHLGNSISRNGTFSPVSQSDNFELEEKIPLPQSLIELKRKIYNKDKQKYKPSSDDVMIVECASCDDKLFSNEIDTHATKCKSYFDENIPFFFCTKCNKTFDKQEDLNDHIKQHKSDGKILCPTCGKYLFKNTWEAHNNRHLGIRPHVCDFCNRKFFMLQALRDHIRTHTQEKPFKCKICPKAFTQSSQRAVHNRVHTGYRPNKCIICNKRFSTAANMRVHLKTHDRIRPVKTTAIKSKKVQT